MNAAPESKMVETRLAWSVTGGPCRESASQHQQEAIRGTQQRAMGATASASACHCSKDQEVDVEVTSITPAPAPRAPNPDDNDSQAQDVGDESVPRKGRSRCSLLLRDALVPDLEILRGVSVKDTLRGFGRLWRRSPMDLSEELRAAMWDRSRQLESFDLFLSHTWRTGGLWKFLALTLQCGWQRLLLSWLMAMILVETLAFFDILPSHMNFTAVFEGDSYVFPFGAWGLFLANFAPVVIAIAAPGGTKDCFLDIVSINQVDEELMERGIYGLGGCLAVSKELRILWSKPYLSRLWCVFEIAAYRFINPNGKITLAPLFFETGVAMLWLGQYTIMIIYIQLLMVDATLPRFMVIPAIAPFVVMVHILRRNLLAKQELFASLDNFDVDKAQCAKEFDREFVLQAIENWYGSREAFTDYVRGPLRKELLTKANSGLPPQYIFVIVSPILSLCIDILLGMIKSGFPLRFICCYVLSILFGTILFSGAVQIRISFFMCERFAAPYKPGCCDWLQSVILFLVSAVVGITGFLLSVIAYSTSLGASLAWCAFAICIFGLSHLDWECEEAKRRCCGAPLETSPTTDEDSHVLRIFNRAIVQDDVHASGTPAAALVAHQLAAQLSILSEFSLTSCHMMQATKKNMTGTRFHSERRARRSCADSSAANSNFADRGAQEEWDLMSEHRAATERSRAELSGLALRWPLVASERDAVAAEMLTQVAEGIRAWFYGEEPPGVAPGSRPKKLAPPGLVQYEYQELEASTQKFAQRLGEDDAPVAPPLWLGSGGSSVYRGVLRGSDVAVKVLQDGGDGDRFQDELRALARLRHPNLAELQGWAMHKRTKFLVFEVLSGGSLQQHLGSKDFLWQRRLSAAAQAAEGLSYMVKQKVFHRDIRPKNLLFAGNGDRVKWIYGDDTTSAATDGGMTRLVVTRVSGTPGYACPNYLATKCVSEDTEVYSFGTLLLELAINKPPALEKPTGELVYPLLQLVQNARFGALARVLEHQDPSARWPVDALDPLAALALRCVELGSPKARPRPSFAEIAEVLSQLRTSAAGPRGEAPLEVVLSCVPRPGSDPKELPTTEISPIRFQVREEREITIGRQHQPEFFERFLQKTEALFISRAHFKLHARPGGPLQLEKLSSNPLHVDGVAAQQGQMVTLCHGAKLGFGRPGLPDGCPVQLLVTLHEAAPTLLSRPAGQVRAVPVLECVKTACVEVSLQTLPREAKVISLSQGITKVGRRHQWIFEKLLQAPSLSFISRHHLRVSIVATKDLLLEDENADASDERVQHVLEAFKKYDKDGDGMIDFVELGALMRGLAGSAAEWTDASIKVLLTAMDSDNDGKVVLSDFGVWLFGTQLSPMEESKLKTAELTLQASNAKAKAQSKAAAKAKGKAKAKAKPVPEEEEEEGEDEEGGDDPEDDEGEDEEDSDEYDEDDVDVKQLSMTGRNALWQKLMPARAGSAQDAAERMKNYNGDYR
ncbi:putative serine/threonine-protein kinase [Symbiodinium microadriaticum]|uniref:Putative serine/threonine-protein kinase n=1 Tax=Symbiodinium microadriaticum TaxID=2951 RepID=A0A1Q9DNI8_SYMMI|nr:putative serine/threonine-protein kinase [Symbiodinium microadriaticum]